MIINFHFRQYFWVEHDDLISCDISSDHDKCYEF